MSYRIGDLTVNPIWSEWYDKPGYIYIVVGFRNEQPIIDRVYCSGKYHTTEGNYSGVMRNARQVLSLQDIKKLIPDFKLPEWCYKYTGPQIKYRKAGVLP